MILALAEVLCGVFCISAKTLMPDVMFQAAGGALAAFGLLEIAIVLLSAKA